MPNLPTEEVFTTPDPQRVDGVVTSTKPLVLSTAPSSATCACASRAAAAVELDARRARRTSCARSSQRDAGAARLGEVALVDDEGRIGPLDTVFYDTLLDENAATHIALGPAFPFLAGDAETAATMNESDIHIDFMIGSDELDVTGITRGGERVPVLVGGAWQL